MVGLGVLAAAGILLLARPRVDGRRARRAGAQHPRRVRPAVGGRARGPVRPGQPVGDPGAGGRRRGRGDGGPGRRQGARRAPPSARCAPCTPLRRRRPRRREQRQLPNRWHAGHDARYLVPSGNLDGSTALTPRRAVSEAEHPLPPERPSPAAGSGHRRVRSVAGWRACAAPPTGRAGPGMRRGLSLCRRGRPPRAGDETGAAGAAPVKSDSRRPHQRRATRQRADPGTRGPAGRSGG